MKRANQLQPLSREHHLGLHVSRHAKECPDHPQPINEHWTALTDYINKDMSHHFSIEDNLIVSALMPFKDKDAKVAEVLDNLESQHQELAKLTQLEPDTTTPSVERVKKLANALYDHIRFEERELFPTAEKYLNEATLDSIYSASADNVKLPEEQR